MDAAKELNSMLFENIGLFAEAYNSTPALQEELKGTAGWLDFSLGMTADDGSIGLGIVADGGKIRVVDSVPENPDAVIRFADMQAAADYFEAPKEVALSMFLQGKVKIEGNANIIALFDYLQSNLLEDAEEASPAAVDNNDLDQRRVLDEQKTGCRNDLPSRRNQRLKGKRVDPGVEYLEDPFLADYGLEDFPRLSSFREQYMNAKGEVSAEHGKLLTDFFLANGYETKKNGEAWDPNLRRAESFDYQLSHKKPVIREDDLIAGSYAENPVFGGVTQPYAFGLDIWSELRTFQKRGLQPQTITHEARDTLHRHVFPFWAKRNIMELWKEKFDYPLPARIHEKFFAMYYWKTFSANQIAPAFEVIMKKGTNGLISDIEKELNSDGNADEEKVNTLKAMIISLKAVNRYAENLEKQVAKEAIAETDSKRKAELQQIQANLSKVPMEPANTLDEAIQSLMIMHICLGMETTDDGPSFGRLDQILQPYFKADIEKLDTAAEREEYIKHAIGIFGCLYMKINSHYIPVNELTIWLNSGAPPSQTITVGGTTPDGKDAVNDMSYIILKVQEMLGLNDPNVSVRFKVGVNSKEFLKRGCAVNYITGSMPNFHCDDAMFQALTAKGFELEDVRDWTPIGCVEPGIVGKHASCTSSLEMNLVAPLEMALNNGTHPLHEWDLGPKTGSIENGDFKSFEDFWQAFKAQCEFILEQGVVGNNQLGEIYQEYHPAPLLSSLLEGCIENGRVFSKGGAKYNSSGFAIMGFADVVDSLLVIKQLVFDEKKFDFKDLKKAIDADFEKHPKIHAIIKSKLWRYGSSHPDTVEMARRVAGMVSNYLENRKNHRGGTYSPGYWSMSLHVAYGIVSGALPSGRKAGEPFTPGLTPDPTASENLLDNLTDVAQLDPTTISNNVAFNVRIVPKVQESPEELVGNMADYVHTYFDRGGMQLQFNVVDTDILKDAMANPEHYRDLTVRISGYVGYFTQLHPDLQREVIRRAEYAV